MARHRFEVHWRRITFVLVESIDRPAFVGFPHPSIAGDLCQDARPGDRITEAVPFDQGRVFAPQRRHAVAIDQGMRWDRPKALQGLVHRAVRGAQDVQRIDLLGGRFGDREFDSRHRGEQSEKLVAPRLVDLFRIVQVLEIPRDAVEDPCQGKDHRGGNHGASERAAPRFVDAGETQDSASDQVAFVDKSVRSQPSGCHFPGFSRALAMVAMGASRAGFRGKPMPVGSRHLTSRARVAYLRVVSVPVRKLGLLLSCAVTEPGFRHGVRLAQAALAGGVDVYLYCIDDGVTGVRDPELQSLRGRGLKLYACAYGAHQRGLPVDDTAAYAGLTVVSDLIASTDRFVSFN